MIQPWVCRSCMWTPQIFLYFCFSHVHWSSRHAVTTLSKSLITLIWLFCIFLRSVHLSVLTSVMTSQDSMTATRKKKKKNYTEDYQKCFQFFRKKKSYLLIESPSETPKIMSAKAPMRVFYLYQVSACIMKLNKQCIEQQAQMCRHLWKTDHSHIGANTDNVAWWGSRGGDRKDIKDSHWLQRHSYYLMYSAFKMNL